MHKCLYCYKPLHEGEVDYHAKCTKKFFGIKDAPLLPYTRSNINELAKEVVRSSITVPGVQPKLSIDIESGRTDGKQRFTIVGLWGSYILKPPTDLYPHLPELEDLTMHMAEAAGIKTVPHTLIRFADGELCYLTRRIDRTQKGNPLAMEDMCQLTERLTEDKYKASYEGIARTIKKYSEAPLLDITNFWQVVLFSWVVGNADMHLKNFSLYRPQDTYILTPAYDLLSTALVLPADTEELALPLNGKKRKIKKSDFELAMASSGLTPKVIKNIFKRITSSLTKWEDLIRNSFLPKPMQESYITQITHKLNILH